MEVAVRLVVTGRVQGVFFRDWTVREAEALGLRGWVRNRGDGAVEIAAAGAQHQVERFIARCGDGPERAAVSSVTREDVAVTSIDSEGFTRRPTARSIEQRRHG